MTDFIQETEASQEHLPNPVSFGTSFVAGTVGGIAQVLVGQPFDIVKVRLQSSNEYSSAFNAVTSIFKNEGPLAFYKGTAVPLVGIGLCVSLQFAFLNVGKSTMASIEHRSEHNLSPVGLYCAGGIAGLGNTIASTPVEHIRIRMQTAKGKPMGLAETVKKIYASDGLRGIFQGLGITTIREINGYGIYFLAYESMMRWEMNRKHILRSDVSMAKAGLYGALSGMTMWVVAYPLDLLKSRIQTDGFPSQPLLRKYNGIVDCIRKTYAELGLAGFYRGIGPSLVRAPIANAATFIAYEATLKYIS